MKFAEHLSAHITPEWRKQYIQHEVPAAGLGRAPRGGGSPAPTSAAAAAWSSRAGTDFAPPPWPATAASPPPPAPAARPPFPSPAALYRRGNGYAGGRGRKGTARPGSGVGRPSRRCDVGLGSRRLRAQPPASHSPTSAPRRAPPRPAWSCFLLLTPRGGVLLLQAKTLQRLPSTRRARGFPALAHC